MSKTSRDNYRVDALNIPMVFNELKAQSILYLLAIFEVAKLIFGFTCFEFHDRKRSIVYVIT
jgi:hypothetical protein